VTLTYLDTSAAMKFLVEEAESQPLVDALGEGRRLVACWLLHTELHCAAGRHPDLIDPATVDQVLESVDLVDLDRGDLLSAGERAPLRSHDAIHLAVALRLEVDELVTYDRELAAAATSVGIDVLAPGVEP